MIIEKKIILTGFQRFNGLESNISELVLKNIEQNRSLNHCISMNQSSIDNFSLQSGNLVIRIYKITLPVRWDEASKILLQKIEDIDPYFLFMTGLGSERNKGYFEGGAYNLKTNSPGFSDDGQPMEKKFKGHISLSKINDHRKAQFHYKFSNKINHCFNKTKTISNLYQIQSMKKGRKNNTYLCNEISYLSSLNYPKLAKTFFHYPLLAQFRVQRSQTKDKEIEFWGTFILKSILQHCGLASFKEATSKGFANLELDTK